MWQDRLKEIIYILEHSDVNEIDLTFIGRRYRVVKTAPVATNNTSQPPSASPVPVSPILNPVITDLPVEETVSGHQVLSPMPGTFYLAPGPKEDMFVHIGDHVKTGDTLCIIEAMKIMNEIEAEMSGIVKKVLVENAQPVEYNQPLFIIDPDG